MNPKALIRSTSLVIASIALFTILSELFPPVKNFFALFGHHWIGKSVLALSLLAVLYLLFSKADEKLDQNSVWWLIGTVVLSGIAIACFYTLHFIW